MKDSQHSKRHATVAQAMASSSDDTGKSTLLATAAGQATFVLILINAIVFLCDHVLHLPAMKLLYLNHAHPQWHQWITHQFCHGSFQHLSANLFPLLIFGGKVEETEGAFGIACVYLLCGTGAAIASFLLTPAWSNGHMTVSVGASGAIFGLFIVSVLSRLKWGLRPLVEAAILGQFVVQQVGQEMKSQFAGVLLVWLLHKVSDRASTKEME
ncbi:MAG: hypothetical protein WDW38_003405 [Sanguina aurantia]